MAARTTLLLIHGFPHDHALWDPQRSAFGESVDVIAPDLRGFGKRGPVEEVITMEEYAEDLVHMLDTLGIDRVVVCGLSMGGYVAMALMTLALKRVRALILCNTRATADNEEGKAAREQTAKDALEKGMDPIARAMLPKVLSEKTLRERPQLVREVEAMMSRQNPQAVAAASRGMALRLDRTGWLRGVKIPTLIITGDHDQLMPLATSEAMHAAVPHSQLVVIPGAAHLSNLENPGAFNSAVGSFLRSLPDA